MVMKYRRKVLEFPRHKYPTLMIWEGSVLGNIWGMEPKVDKLWKNGLVNYNVPWCMVYTPS